MMDILFPVLLSALVIVSGAEISENTIEDLHRFRELLEKAGPFSLTNIRQNRGIKCAWENMPMDFQGQSCEEVQEFLEARDDLKEKFRSLCGFGDLDLCLKEKDLSGKISRFCFCSSRIPRQFRNKCYDTKIPKEERTGRGCACNDKNYCNSGDNFDYYASSDDQNGNEGGGKDDSGHKDGTDGSSKGDSGGGDLPSALAATTLVFLGLFGPRLF